MLKLNCALTVSPVSASMAVTVMVAVAGKLKELKKIVALPATTLTGPWPSRIRNSLTGVVGSSSVVNPPVGLTGLIDTDTTPPVPTSEPSRLRQVIVHLDRYGEPMNESR